MTITAYPDTAEGAIQMLGDLSSYDMTGATAKQDPVIVGVWYVTHAAGKTIVYITRHTYEAF